MAPADFREILRRLDGYTEYLSLHVLGEPLLHPDLGLFLDLCQSHGFKVNLSTNGTLLARNQAMLLGKLALRQINISLHSFEGQGEGPELELYLDEVLEFARQANNATPILLNFRLWNLRAGDGAVRNDRILRRLESFFDLGFKIPGDLTPGQGITLAPGIFLSQARQFSWPHAPGPDLGRRGFCFGMRDHLAVLVDGTVVPCCLDAEADINLGNIRHAPLGEILATPRASMLWQGFLRQQLLEPLCRRCSYRQRFAPAKPSNVS